MEFLYLNSLSSRRHSLVLKPVFPKARYNSHKEVIHDVANARSFEICSSYFALNPEAQAYMERRLREEFESNVMKQEEIEADERERGENEKIEYVLKEATAAKVP